MESSKKKWIIAALFFAAGLLQILNHDYSVGAEDSLGLIAGGLFIIAGVTYIFQSLRSSSEI